MPSQKTQPKAADIVAQVAERIRTSDNVLVALSKDPTVDELSAALGLTFILDKIGKRATAIFSGVIPNAIEFLEPEKTFEANTDSLQDFIIALDKDKADHLRYKIDGDYVKVFITPYKTTIDESDMEFSHGDYNVDLVISLNVSEVGDLDAALSEYGRIMHDATSINISAGVAGNFGDIEWGDPAASSVSEMIGMLADSLKDKDDILDKPTSTALLAGIVAATNRFSNERTTPETMALASKLMAAGADQQLISSSIPVEILTEDVVDANADFAEPTVDNTTININNPAENLPVTPVVSAVNSAPVTEPAPVAPAGPVVPVQVATPAVEPALAETPVESVPAPDPTELNIRHGEVDFDPDEDLSPEERAKKDAERAKEDAERAAREAEERQRRAPIEAAMAEITAKKSGALPSSTMDAKNAAASATASATTKSPLISTVKSNGEAVEDTVAGNNISADASAEPKKKIMPIGTVLERKDEPVNYASMMEAELNQSAAPVPPVAPAPIATPVEMPVETPAMAPVEMPIEAPAMTAPTAPLDNIESAVFVDPTVVAPDAGMVLPPPPAPVVPDAGAYMPPADMPAVPTAQLPSMPAPTSNPVPAPDPTLAPGEPSAADLSAAQIVDGMQATNPVVENTPLMNAGASGYAMTPDAASAMPTGAADQGPEMPATNPGYIVGAEPAPAPAAEPEAATDPSAFHIPGM